MNIPKEKYRVEEFLKKVWCVYFLFDGENLVYIGKTGNLESRILTHTKTKHFDSFSFIKANSEEDALFLEEKFIRNNNPKFNFKCTDEEPLGRYIRSYLPFDEIKKILSETGFEFSINNETKTFYLKKETLLLNKEFLTKMLSKREKEIRCNKNKIEGIKLEITNVVEKFKKKKIGKISFCKLLGIDLKVFNLALSKNDIKELEILKNKCIALMECV